MASFSPPFASRTLTCRKVFYQRLPSLLVSAIMFKAFSTRLACPAQPSCWDCTISQSAWPCCRPEVSTAQPPATSTTCSPPPSCSPPSSWTTTPSRTVHGQKSARYLSKSSTPSSWNGSWTSSGTSTSSSLTPRASPPGSSAGTCGKPSKPRAPSTPSS